MVPATSRLSALALRTFTLLAALTAADPAGLVGQVSPVRPGAVKQAPVITREIPTLAAPDLVIDQAQIAPRSPSQGLLADAFVTVRNAGSADATIRQGAVFVSGAAADVRGMRFANALAAVDFVLKPGETQVAVLRTVDACTAGFGPAPVTFNADPQGTVGERVRSNNLSVVTPAVSDPAASDLVASGLRMQLGTDPRDGRGTAYLLMVTVRNNGTAPALLCPGMTLARQTATPVSAKYGLQSATFAQPASPPPPPPPPNNPDPHAQRMEIDHLPPMYNIVIAPGSTAEFAMFACKSGDLPPGVYEWKVKVNPDGAARESNTGNNELSAQLQGCQ